MINDDRAAAVVFAQEAAIPAIAVRCVSSRCVFTRSVLLLLQPAQSANGVVERAWIRPAIQQTVERVAMLVRLGSRVCCPLAVSSLDARSFDRCVLPDCGAQAGVCQGVCTSLTTNTNCGYCGNQCLGGSTCTSGQCRKRLFEILRSDLDSGLQSALTCTNGRCGNAWLIAHANAML